MGQRIELPKVGCLEHQAQLEKMGFIFPAGEAKDPEALFVTLPEGWECVLLSSYPYLSDKNKNIRGTASVRHGVYTFIWAHAIQIEEKVSYADSDHDIYRVYWEVTKHGQPINYSDTVQTSYAKRSENLQPHYNMMVTWLNEKYPDWHSPFAYWE